MEATEIVHFAIARSGGMMARALEEMTLDDLAARPGEATNPLGWIIWHQSRYLDLTAAAIEGRPQLWIAESWHVRFGMAADPAETGIGHTMDQVLALRPAREALAGYAAACLARALACLEGLPPEGLDRPVPDFLGSAELAAGRETLRAGDLLGRMLSDYIQHAGQVFFMMGHLKGHGWYPR